MIKEIIKDLEREDIIEIVENCVAWGGLFFVLFMVSVIGG